MQQVFDTGPVMGGRHLAPNGNRDGNGRLAGRASLPEAAVLSCGLSFQAPVLSLQFLQRVLGTSPLALPSLDPPGDACQLRGRRSSTMDPGFGALLPA